MCSHRGKPASIRTIRERISPGLQEDLQPLILLGHTFRLEVLFARAQWDGHGVWQLAIKARADKQLEASEHLACQGWREWARRSTQDQAGKLGVKRSRMCRSVRSGFGMRESR
eukprot:685678-Amphidinium_carterae.1